MDPDCEIAENDDIFLKLALEKLYTIILLKVKVDHSSLVKGVEVP